MIGGTYEGPLVDCDGFILAFVRESELLQAFVVGHGRHVREVDVVDEYYVSLVTCGDSPLEIHTTQNLLLRSAPTKWNLPDRICNLCNANYLNTHENQDHSLYFVEIIRLLDIAMQVYFDNSPNHNAYQHTNDIPPSYPRCTGAYVLLTITSST